MVRCIKWFAAQAVFAMCLLFISCNGIGLLENSTAAEIAANANAAPDMLGGNGISLRITWKSYSGRGETIQRIVDQYNQTADASIQMIDGDEDRETIEFLLQTETEAVYVLPYRFIKYFGDKGYLADVTDIFKNEKKLFYPAVWALSQVEDRTYGVPWLGHAMCLLYNQSLLKQAEVEPDQISDMDDFIAAIQTIANKTGARGLGLVGAQSNDLSWMVNQFIYGYGSGLVSDDGKTVMMDHARASRALHLYRDVLGPYAQPTWLQDTALEVMDAFRNQEIAFEILGIWGVTDVQKNGAPFDVGVLPLDAIGLCSEIGPMMLAVPQGMSEMGKAIAYDFIRYMISKDAQEEIMKGEYNPEHDRYYPFRTPIRADMMDNHVFTDHPEYQYFIQGFQNPSIDVPVPAWQTVKDEVYAPGLHQVMMGEMTIDEFLETVQQQGNPILQAQ